MSKIGFYLLGLFSGILPSLYAWKQVDEANRTKPEVRVIKEYSGTFRGWGDSCLNCDQDVANSGRIVRNREQQVAYRMGYCECNCGQQKTRE
jgi:hypothetical protein